MTVTELMDAVSVLRILRTEHGVDTDPAFGPLTAADFRFIADGINGDWNSFDLAREVAARVDARSGSDTPKG